ncbi:Por secretion system C-terminal sorting domain-containing protein [Winogradskyella thalassocola]|uniref:Por secretion system C-terminal sorting domain-containing protein n=1 Tax=Winogradskyella thalassocola TaxID=262004 RepID=A0A1G8F2E5_9FLAO|nr:Por secretion system C-terminal sorting domain-containing protein [Winogradskyella thalassocola]
MSLALMLITTFFNLNAQIAFEKVLPQSSSPLISNDFEGVTNSGLDYSDIDNDGDQDVLITGTDRLGQKIATLYLNDGLGNYSEISGTSFVGVNQSTVHFFDADGDNDEDVLISGADSSNQRITKLYTNNGSGDFTEVLGTPFDGVTSGSVSIADIEGDSDLDVLITGYDSSSQKIAKLYTNNGGGVFSEIFGTIFENVGTSAASFNDIDGDNDQDVLITGINNLNQRIAKLYTNDGSGIFSEVVGTSFEPVNGGEVVFVDIDGDNDEDVFLTGYSSNLEQRISKLYTNNGSGVFSEVLATPFEGVQQGGVSFADIDGDLDQDLLITGYNGSSQGISKLYINNGSGVFSLDVNTPMEGVWNGALSFLDIDNDSDLDLLLTGSGYSGNKVSKLFVNDGSGFFREVTGSTFTNLGLSSNKFSDIDNDGDEDLLISGLKLNQYITEVYENNGSGEYILNQAIPINDFFGEVSFIDIDGDNDEDLIFVGYILPYQPITKLYRNDGLGNFTEILGTSFVGLTSSSIAYADIDGDNDQDVLIAGKDSSNNRRTLLYSNDGNGNYQLVSGTPFTGVFAGSIAFADVDGDNDQDVLITGVTDNYGSYGISRLYTNNGSGVFSYVLGTPFDDVRTSAIAFADIDNDGDQDVLITGRNSSNEYISKLYDNDGSGGFTLNTDSTLQSYSTKRAVGFTDIDGDTDLDLIMIGGGVTNLYTNDSFGVFTLEINTILEGVSNGSLAFSDIDTDNDIDVLISGKNSVNEETTFLYRNVSIPMPPIIADTTSLLDLTAQCEATPTAPTANSGAITATADVAFPLTTQDTTIVTWTYDDGIGNTLTQTQNIIINDSTGPSMSFTNPSDATIESCDTEVLVPSPQAIEDCLTNDFALDFDGVDDFVSINQAIGSFGTIEFWMYTENGINGSEEFDFIFNFNNSLLQYAGTGNVTSDFAGETFTIVTNFGQLMAITELIPAGWNHIAITGNGSIYDKIILNGVSKSTIGLGTPVVINASSLFIGKRQEDVSSRFLGKLDEIRFWNTPRTEQEVADDFEKIIDASTPNLLAYYDFEDGIGSSILSDKTSTNANGVLTNMNINTDWVTSDAPISSVTLTNDFNGTSDASGTYPEGETTVTWTATDPLGNQSTLEQTVNIVCSITYTFNNDVWSPSDPNGVATAIDNLIITSGNANISSNTTVNSVTVEAGASLTLDAALSATDITLNSTAGSYSSLLTGASSSASGIISYNRFVNSNSLGNDLISSPLSGETWSDFLSPENATALLDNGGTPTIYAFAPFDKTTDDYENYDSNTSAILSSGKGYRAATNTGETLTFSGTVPTDASVNIMNTATAYSQWNLVGNPYPSYLNVHAFLNHEVEAGISNLDLFTNASAAIYGYNATTENSWTIYNLANTTASTVIAPGQGFFVSADATHVAAHNLEFTTAMQTTGTSDDFIAGRNADLELIYLKIGLSSNTSTYNTDVYFNGNASEGLDKGYDADLWGSVVPEFSIYSHLVQDNTGKPIALQALNTNSLSNVSIPLGVHANLGEQITFSISETTLPATINVFLDDVLTNTSTLLTNSDYTITPSTDLSGTGRFFLRTTEEALSIADNNFDAISIFYEKRAKDVLINGRIQNNTVVEIYDMQGRKVLSSPLDAAVLENRIHVASLNAGVYLVNLKNSLEQKTQKIIIN